MIDLPTLIAHAESDDNAFAMRYEPVAYTAMVAPGVLDAIMKPNKCNQSTARVIRATSWGRFQIMGFNLYASPALAVSVGWYMADDQLQAQQFARFCHDHDCWMAPGDLHDDVKLLRFAVIYNGPRSPEMYRQRLKDVLARLEGTA